MFRFSLAALLLFVLLAALGCAALVNANELWRQTTTTAALTLLLGATLAAILWQGERKAAATGFALFGWSYLALAFVAAFGLRNDLLTEKAVSWLYPAIHGEEQPSVGASKRYQQVVTFVPDGGTVVSGGTDLVTYWDVATGQTILGGARPMRPSYKDFADIGHVLWALLAAGLGAAAARFLFPAQTRKASSSDTSPGVVESRPDPYSHENS
jgi:hypothetical protein